MPCRMSRTFGIWGDLAPDPRNLCDHVDRLSCFSRISVFCRILFKRYDFGSGVWSAYKCRLLAFWLGCAAALLTAFYSWRLLIMAFHGTPRASDEIMAHVHESPNVMTLPLVPLALGAIFAGWMGYDLFVGNHWQEFWGDSLFILPTHQAMEAAHHVPTWVKLLPIGLLQLEWWALILLMSACHGCCQPCR